MMKAIQISRLQVIIAVTFAALAGMSGPIVRRSLTAALQEGTVATIPPLNPSAATGFDLVSIITASGFLLAWACMVAVNHQQDRRSGRGWLLLLPVVLCSLGLAAAGRLHFSSRGAGPDLLSSVPVQMVRESGSAAVTVIETFWLSAAAIAILLLVYYSFMRVSPRQGRAPDKDGVNWQ